MYPFTWQNPTRIHFGKNQIQRLNDEIKNYSSILLVYGGKSIKQNGLYEEVVTILKQQNKTFVELSGVEPNPKMTSVYEGIDLVRKHKVDLILSVGGGSVIDCGKAIAIGSVYEGDAFDLITGKASVPSGIDLGCILTLSATGTEMNPRAVISHDDQKLKLGIGNWNSDATYPNFSILDPTYTFTVSREQTVYGIIDIISHVLEQYFHDNGNTMIADRFAEGIIKTMMEVGPKLIHDLDNYELRETMMYAGLLAWNGMLRVATNGGDWSSHRIEHALSAVYDIPHGGGLAIVIPTWMEHAIELRKERFTMLAQNVFEVEDGYEVIQKMKEFYALLDAPKKLVDYSIPMESISIDELVDKTMLGQEYIGSYVKLNKEDVYKIIEKCIH